MTTPLQVQQADYPAWMDNCLNCIDLMNSLAEVPAHPLPIQQIEAVYAHWVEDHYGKLPAYQENCPVCQEHQEKTSHYVGATGVTTTPQDRAAADRHRAGHLIYQFN